MHIVDGVLSPEVCAVTAAASLGAVGYSIHRLKDSLADRTIPMTGMMASLIFAGQMVNFPIGGPVSGHLLGGVLASVLLGPWAGCLALTTVLIVQHFFFADGGLLSLGANVLHMGVVGSIGGYGVYLVIRRLLGNGSRGIVVGAVIASWVSVMAAAALFCVEFRLTYRAADYDFTRIFALMVSFHSVIGVGEALITGSVIGFVLRHRSDLIYTSNSPAKWGQFSASVAAAGVACALAVAAFLAPFASDAPDGMNAALPESLQAGEPAESASLFPLQDYRIPAPFKGWERAAGWEKLSVSLAGILGCATVFVIALSLGHALKTCSPRREATHAE